MGGLRCFSRAKLHITSATSYPFLGGKGSDTIIVLKWLVLVVGLALFRTDDDDYKRLLEIIRSGLEGGLTFSQGIHGHAVFLERACARHIKDALGSFTYAYGYLAHYAFRHGLFLFGQVPKIHSLAHFKYELWQAAVDGRRKFKVNPAVFDTSQNEDFIGKVSKMSRRIAMKNNRHQFERTILQRYMIKARITLKTFKKKRGY